MSKSPNLSSRPEHIIAKAMICEVESPPRFAEALSAAEGEVEGDLLYQEVVLTEEDGMKSSCALNLHNAVTVSQQRMGKRVAQLSPARMNEVCAALRFSLCCDSN
jgi:hypothetical protein